MSVNTGVKCKLEDDRPNLRVVGTAHHSALTDLTHEDVEDPGGNMQREGGEEDGEEPGGGIHGGVKALSLEMYMKLWELLL